MKDNAETRSLADELGDWRVRYAFATTTYGRDIARRRLTELGETAEGFAHLDRLADPIGPMVCGWIIDGDAGLTCDRKATRGTAATGPLCDEHGEEHERESEGR